LCHDTETCTTSCTSARRRRAIDSDSTENGVQENGIEIPKILSAEIVVPDDTEIFSPNFNLFEKLVANLDGRMKNLRKAVSGVANPIRRLNELL